MVKVNMGRSQSKSKMRLAVHQAVQDPGPRRTLHLSLLEHLLSLSQLCRLFQLFMSMMRNKWRAQRFADSFISRSVTYVKNMPRQHLAICMEYVGPKLELAFTSECSLQGLLALLWLYSRVKPCVKVLSDLRSLPAVVYGNHCLFLLLVCASQCQYTVLVAHRLCDQNFPLPLSDSCLLRLHQIRGLLQVNETCPHQNFVWHWDGAVQGPNCGQVPTGP